MFSCEAESSVQLPPSRVERIFALSFSGEGFWFRQAKPPHELFKTGTRGGAISESLHNKSERWLFKEHSCVKFNY